MYFNQNEFGMRLAGVRKERGMTQEELAEALGIGRQHVSSMETGVKACSIDLLVELSGLLDVSTDYLLTGAHRDTREAREQLTAIAARLIEIAGSLQK